MSWIVNYIWLIPVVPFIGFLFSGINAFTGNKIFKDKTKHIVKFVSPIAVLISFTLGVIAYIHLLGLPEEARHFTNVAYSWISIGHLKVTAAFTIDPLSMLMVLVVTGVGFLIHVYSIGYMADDEGFTKFFAYLNLFTFAMLLLVLGDNVLIMFVGWEGVGLCSYLLIGFWYTDKEKAIAGMKAFIVNRIGDFGFLIGIFLLFWGMLQYGHATTLSFSEMPALVKTLPEWYVTAIVIALFVGATGKSAQIPLYVWLPDAMAGPTPVSALIHAATMVTSGVYMIARLNFLFSSSPVGLTVIAIIATATAFFAATIGIVQNDIKKVLAYSTVSQLGYMFMAMGVGAYTAGVFHLMTHAFFKGLLFLGSGSVIMAMHHEQDMRKMGGLKEKIPYTHYTFLIGTIAISGVPFFSGFFSKDEILWKAFSNTNIVLPSLPTIMWVMGVITAGLTAFYMFRLYFMTFWGKFRGDHHTWEHMKESPKTVTIPLMILAVAAFLGGYLGVPEALGGHNIIHHWLSPVISEPEFVHGEHHSHALEYILMSISIVVAFSGIFLAYYLYVVKVEANIPGKIVAKFKSVHALLYDKYRIDELYAFIVLKNVARLQNLLKWFDENIVDGIVNGVAVVMKFISRIHGWMDKYVVDGAVNLVGNSVGGLGIIFRKAQTGLITTYFYYIIGGVAILYIAKIVLLK